MNTNNSTELIDEAELRLVLLPFRQDRNKFHEAVQKLIAEKQISGHKSRFSDEQELERSPWLQTAAAVIPLPLLNQQAGLGLVKLGQLSLGKKIVAIAASPLAGLLLMAITTIWAIRRIRRAQRGQTVLNIDVLKQSEAISAWWRTFGFWCVGLIAITVLLMFTDYPPPAFLLLLISGGALVSLVTQLGREKLIDRSVITAALCPSLIILGQFMHIATMINRGLPLLDQMLIPAVLLLASLVIVNLCDGAIRKKGGAGYKWGLNVGLLMLAAWFSSSLWHPISSLDLKSSVESFDHAKFSSASWQQWQVQAQWLIDFEVPLDLSKPKALLQEELARENPNRSILLSAIETGLLERSDLDAIGVPAIEKQMLLDRFNQGKPLYSVESHENFMMRALVTRGELSEDDRDFLQGRLIATMESLKTQPYQLLEKQLAITKLARLIDRPLNLDSQRNFVHQILVSNQRLESTWGSRRGGFTSSTELEFSDLQATISAIELMEIYGVPDGVHLHAVRSYLRPSMNDRWDGLRSEASVRAVGMKRLANLPGSPSATWRDYLNHEQGLIAAILLSIVCVLSVAGAPNLEVANRVDSRVPTR